MGIYLEIPAAHREKLRNYMIENGYNSEYAAAKALLLKGLGVSDYDRKAGRKNWNTQKNQVSGTTGTNRQIEPTINDIDEESD